MAGKSEANNGAYRQRRIRMHDEEWANVLWLAEVTGAPSPAHIIREAVEARVQEVRVRAPAREVGASKRSEPG